MLHQREKAQSTVEYAIIIAVVISALLAMQFWMRRGVMGKLRDSSDQIGDQFNPFAAAHDVDKGFNSTRTDTGAASGLNVTTGINDQQTETNGTRTEAGNMNNEGTLF